LGVTVEIIGRRDELAAFERFLDIVPSGPAALFVEGAAGIGKTRLWQHALDSARDRGFRVLSARSGGAEVQLAFAGLADLLGDALDDVLPALPPPQRRALAIALLLEDVRGVPPDQRAVSAAFFGALGLLAAERPVVVAVDDLQWLDADSAFVLAFAARRLESEPVGLLGTVRLAPEEAEPTELARAIGDERLTRLPLGPMSVSAVYELIRARLDFPLPRSLLLRVHETSEGNPFLALELARELQHTGRDVPPDEPLPVPHRVRELVLARLARLPESAHETLLTAAALSQPTLDLLERATSKRAVDDIRAATEAGVLELDGTQVRFTHPLLASIHYESAPPSRRRKVHGRLAHVATDGEERARHLALAADGPDEEVAAALAAAVAVAEARGAVPAAADLAARAVALTPPRSRARLHRRRIEAGRRAFAAGDHAAARRLLENALAAARPGSERAEALLELGTVLNSEDLRVGIELFRQAAAEPEADARLRASILVQLAWAEGYSGAGYEHALRLARDAVALAEGAADEQLLAQALSTQGFLELIRGRGLPHAVMQRAEAIEAANRLRVDGPTEMYGEMLANHGQHAEARKRLERVIAVGRETGDVGVCRPLFRLAATEWQAGDWDRAWELGLEAERIAAQSGRETIAPLGSFILALIEAMRGNVDAGRARGLAALAATDRAGRHSGGPRGALAFIELSLERYQEAYEFVEPYLELTRGRDDDLPEAPQSDAVEALVGLGRVSEARALLTAFAEASARLGMSWALAAAARCRGLVAVAEGDLQSADASLDEAVSVGETAGRPLELGRSLLILGSLQRRRGEKGTARLTLARALDLFERLGTPVWAERTRRELRRIGGRPAATGGLSETETQIVELVVAGRSNKEVAHALHLSPKTVEWNLSKVYRKLGVHSRTELAAARTARR
jgi:DNA-binding CsgD family transcriptional regulator